MAASSRLATPAISARPARSIWPPRSSAWHPLPTGSATGSIAADGGVFTFGDAPYEGAGAPTSVALAASHDGHGYWITRAGGQVSPFGDAPTFAP